MQENGQRAVGRGDARYSRGTIQVERTRGLGSGGGNEDNDVIGEDESEL